MAVTGMSELEGTGGLLWQLHTLEGEETAPGKRFAGPMTITVPGGGLIEPI